MKKGILALMLGGLALCISGCLGGEKGRQEVNDDHDRENGRLKVVATLFPYYDFTRQIAGDVIDLELIIPAGMDSHSFEPTPADMRKIQEADVVICNGGSLEHWVSEVLDAVDTSHMTVVTMMDYVDTVEEELVEGMEEAHDHDHDRGGQAEEGHDHGREAGSGEARQAEEGHEHGTEAGHTEAGHTEADHRDSGAGHMEDVHEAEAEYDEHIWTSPINAMTCTEVIARTLSEADPSHLQVYEAGKDRYQGELLALHRKFLDMTEGRKRNLIVVGDKFPFRYLAEEYGLEYRAAFSGCSTDTEPSARTIAYLIDRVREEELPAVYYLELSSHRVSEIIGEETGAVPLLLHSCHNVTRREFENGVTYLELMEQNIEHLRKGLVE